MTPRKGPPIGIYGGTFDPIHLGHMHAARTFLSACQLQKLYIVPTGISPHKQNRAADIPQTRFTMLKLAFAEAAYADPRIILSDYEQTHPGKSYTVLTLEHFQKESDNLFLLCGTDMFLTLASWYRGADILTMATIVCLERSTDISAHKDVLKQADFYQNTYGTQVVFPAFSPLPISSTEIRRRLADGLPVDGLLPASVQFYLKEHPIYQNEHTI